MHKSAILLSALLVVVVVATVNGYVPGGSVDCQTAAAYCQQNFAPVCGTNKKTYANECYLKKDTCDLRLGRNVKNIGLANNGVCTTPQALLYLSTSTAPAGYSVYVHCGSIKNQGAEYIFFLNGNEYTRKAAPLNVIEVIAGSDTAGTWTCQVVDTSGETSAVSDEVILTLESNSQLLFASLEVSDLTPSTDTFVTFTCKIQSDVPLQWVFFLRDGVRVGQFRVRSPGNPLIATYRRTMKFEDEGTWSCTGVVRGSGGFYLHVTSAPLVITIDTPSNNRNTITFLTVSPRNVDEGEPIIATCATNMPSGEYIFIINGERRRSNTPNIFISAASLALGGDWTCSSGPHVSNVVTVVVKPDIVCMPPATNEGVQGTVPAYIPGSVATFSCSNSYRHIGGDSSRRCTPTGEWDGSDYRCEKIRCQVPTYGAGIELVNQASAYDISQTISFNCANGYSYTSGDAQHHCGPDGNWLGSAYQCQQIECVVPSYGSGVEVVEEKSFYGLSSVLKFRCQEGYRLVSGANLECGPDGQWVGDLASCELVQCGIPTYGSGVEIVNQPSVYNYGSSIQFSCQQGYRVRSQSTMTCGPDGAWSGDVLQCEQINCQVPSYGSGVEVVSQSSAYTLGNKLVFRCQEGYRLVSGSDLECGPDGNWIGDIAQCELVKCSVPSYGSGLAIVNEASTYSFSNNLVFRCVEGYRQVSGGSLRCGPDGNWIGDLTECELVVCNVPSYGSGVRIVDQSSAYNFGSNLKLACLDGYRFTSGSQELRCGPDGNWVGDLYNCELAMDSPILVASSYVVDQNTNTRVGLTCLSFDEDIDGYEYAFFLNGQETKGTGNTIYIDISTNPSGDWTCRVKNPAISGAISPSSNTATITIVDSMDFDTGVVIRMGKSSARVGQTTWMHCATAEPFAKYAFFKDGVIVQDGPASNISLTVGSDSEGMYTCMPYNSESDKFSIAPAAALFFSIDETTAAQPKPTRIFSYVSMRPQSTYVGGFLGVTCSTIGGPVTTIEFLISDDAQSQNGLREAYGPKEVLQKNADSEKEGWWWCRSLGGYSEQPSIVVNKVQFQLEDIFG